MRTEKHFTASRAIGATHGAHFTTNILLHNDAELAGNEACAALLRRFQPAVEIERGVVCEMAATAKDQIRKVAAACEGVLGRSRAISEAQRQISRLSRQWRQGHEKLKDLQGSGKENIENEPNETRVP